MLAQWKRKYWATDLQVLGPAGSGVTSYQLQLVQQGILDEDVEKNYSSGDPYCTKIEYGGVVRKLGLRDILVGDDEDRFEVFRHDYLDRKPMGVIWVAPGRPEILKDKEARPEYDLFRRYVQFLVSKTYPMAGGKEKSKPLPRFLVLVINHMDIYERLWQVNYFDFLHHYRAPLSYIRKHHKKVNVVTIPCCAWAGVNVREPIMDIMMSIEIEG